MDKKYTFKKLAPYALAITIGAGIVAVTLLLKNIQQDEVVNNNISGNDDWISTLRVVSDNATSTHIGTQRGLLGISTTTTDRIGRELLMEYALAQSQSTNTTISDKSAQAIADHLVQRSSITHETPYTSKDILLAPDTTEAFIAYGKKINTLITTFNTQFPMNELTILTKALNSRKEEDIAPLLIQISAYKNLEKNLLSVKVPPMAADLHLRLVQNYAHVRLSVESMSRLFTDPAQSLASVPQYAKDLEALVFVAKDFAAFKIPQQNP